MVMCNYSTPMKNVSDKAPAAPNAPIKSANPNTNNIDMFPPSLARELDFDV